MCIFDCIYWANCISIKVHIVYLYQSILYIYQSSINPYRGWWQSVSILSKTYDDQTDDDKTSHVDYRRMFISSDDSRDVNLSSLPTHHHHLWIIIIPTVYEASPHCLLRTEHTLGCVFDCFALWPIQQNKKFLGGLKLGGEVPGAVWR